MPDNCKYEDGLVDSCFDCGCPSCSESVAQYEAYLNERAEEEKYNSIMQSTGACHE